MLPVLLAALTVAGCARALREPRSLDTIAGGTAAPAGTGVDELLSEAAALYSRWDLESVRRAADIWARAAAGDDRRVDAVIGGVRARVWLADHEPDLGARQAAASVAVETAQWCARIAPEAPACAYWLGVALGVQARERPSTGLSALSRMVETFSSAAAGAPGLDHAGPDRALALLYLRAPGWPTGPGDVEKGLGHARRAVATEGDYPPNLWALAEALEANGLDGEAGPVSARALQLARERAVSRDPEAREWVEESVRRSTVEPAR